jgi:hypothetical protein
MDPTNTAPGLAGKRSLHSFGVANSKAFSGADENNDGASECIDDDDDGASPMAGIY